MTEEKLKEDKQKRFYHHPSASYNNLKTNNKNNI